jgi:hypothetical protein
MFYVIILKVFDSEYVTIQYTTCYASPLVILRKIKKRFISLISREFYWRVEMGSWEGTIREIKECDRIRLFNFLKQEKFWLMSGN